MPAEPANDPLSVERRRHAETKDQLARAHRRSLELYEQAKRSLSTEAIDVVLEEAVERGRIGDDERDEWTKKLAENPSETVIELAQEREYSRDELDAEARQIAAMHKLDPSEVL